MKDDERVREALRDAPLPGEAEARERGWRVVRAGFAGEAVRPQRGRGRLRLGIAFAGAALIAALVLTPAGAKVVDAFRSVTGIGNEKAEPALSSLPAPGRLLVTSSQGPWVVDENGSKRLLGDYAAATWSPHGLYVATARARELVAIDPANGDVHWTLSRPSRIGEPAWSPTGFRIAYRSGNDLRIVDGAGHGDRLLVHHVAATTPAWQPLGHRARLLAEKGVERTERLAYADRAGRVHLITEGGRAIWTSSPGERRPELLWTADGSRLAAVSRHTVRVFGADGSERATARLPDGATATAAAIAPSGRLLALALSRAGGTQVAHSQVELLGLGRLSARHRSLPSDPGRFTGLAFSPNGRTLLVAWRDADQWLFIPLGGGKVKAVGHISQQFAPGSRRPSAFPQLDGWCCSKSP